jgi:hypothetical protein
MKKNVKPFLLLTLLTWAFTSCVKEDDYNIASFKTTVFKEVFDSNIVNDDEYLNYGEWTSYVQAGSVHWFEKETDNNGYIEFTSYQSGEVSNIAWAISPKINLDNSIDEVLTFNTSSEYVTNSANKIEVYYSSNFDGTNVLSATWTPINATIANNNTNISNTDSNGNINIFSGEIDLSTITGNIYIAFKGIGSGTNTALDGSLRLDNIKIYNKNL